MENSSTQNLRERKTNISTIQHNWQLHPFAHSKPPAPPSSPAFPLCSSNTISSFNYPPAKKMEHIRRIAVNPGPGTGSQWLLRLAIPIEPVRWQWQDREDAWRFSDRKNGEDDLSAKERSSFYSRRGRLFGKRFPIIPHFQYQISQFSGAKLT